MVWPLFLLLCVLYTALPWTLVAETSGGWLTVMFMAKGSSWNAKQLYDTSGGVGSGNVTELMRSACHGENIALHGCLPSFPSVQELKQFGDFRSELVNQWTSNALLQARLVLYSKSGDLLWHVTFQGWTQCADSWLTSSQIQSASNPQLLNHLYDLAIEFSTAHLRLFLRSTGQSYLHVDMAGNGSKTRFLFTTSATESLSVSTEPMDTESTVKNVTTLPTNFTLTGYTMTIFFYSAKYLIGLRVFRTNEGQLTKFKMAYSSDKNCSANLQPYNQGDGQQKVFEPAYSTSDGTLLLLNPVLAHCVSLQAVTWLDKPSVSIFFYFAPEGVLEGAYMAFQWKPGSCFPDCVLNKTQMTLTAQEAAKELVRELTVFKNSTSRYRRQFTSLPDKRGTAVMVGVLGGLLMGALVVGVVALDVSLFKRQARLFRKNVRHCRARLSA